jgi:hypothetical protein
MLNNLIEQDHRAINADALLWEGSSAPQSADVDSIDMLMV